MGDLIVFMKKKDTLFWLNAGLAIIVLLICILIEFLNNTTDNYLPRKDSGKWRQSIFLSEERWREIYSSQKGDESLLSRPLTKAESIQMEKDISRGTAKNALLGAVSSFGLLQYIFAPSSFILSIIIATRNRKKLKIIVSSFFAISSFICIVLMLYRGYFTSLGW